MNEKLKLYAESGALNCFQVYPVGESLENPTDSG